MDYVNYPAARRLAEVDNSRLAILSLAALFREDPQEAERLADADRRRWEQERRAAASAEMAEAA